MIIFMSVSLFSHRPQRCPFGHPLWPGLARVGWKPCICTPAREQAERGRGMGHLWVSCQTCHAQLWDATFYEPPHDISCHQAGPWLCLPAGGW
jgi:ribosomal protein S27E